jgi:hypothetical protein
MNPQLLLLYGLLAFTVALGLWAAFVTYPAQKHRMAAFERVLEDSSRLPVYLAAYPPRRKP